MVLTGKQIASECMMSSFEFRNSESFESFREGLMPNPHSEVDVHHFTSHVPNAVRRGLVIQPLDEKLIAPCGIEFRVADVMYRSDKLRTIKDDLDLMVLSIDKKVERIESSNGKFILEPDTQGKIIYYIPSHERVHLPDNLSLIVDAKSSTGRLGCMCIDRSQTILESGKESNVFVSAQPYAFPIEIEAMKSTLFHAILRYRDSDYMEKKDIIQDKENIALFDGERKIALDGRGMFGKDGLIMRYSVKKALRAKLPNQIPGPIRLDAKGEYKIEDYWDVIEGNGEIEMEAGRFYLLGTKERIRLGNVCAILSRETMDNTGLWGHFAGFIWPGFDGMITMEGRSNCNRIISDGDVAGYLQFDKLDVSLEEAGAYSGVYQHQEVPKAPKMFR
jgi:deoxycytidine triphosphate deaminase